MQAPKTVREAIAVAQRQPARLFELRAAMSMAPLWRDRGKRDEARELVAYQLPAQIEKAEPWNKKKPAVYG